MKKLFVIFLFLGSLIKGQTLIKLNQLQKSAGAGSVIVTDNTGTPTYSTLAAIGGSFVPYTGATSSVNLGTNALVTSTVFGPSSLSIISGTAGTGSITVGGGSCTSVFNCTNSIFNAVNNIFTGSITSPTIYGSSASGGNLLIQSTSNATKGSITLGASTGTVLVPATFSLNGAKLTGGNSGTVAVLTDITANAWSLSGNAVGSNTPFLGPTDNFPLNFRVQNIKSGIIDTIGNAFFGYKAGRFNTDNASTGFGYQAMSTNTAGAGNTAVGYQALKTNTLGSFNVAVGRLCLDVSQGDLNTGVGNGALHLNTTGQYNSAFGGIAMLNNTSGAFNVGVGGQALNGCTTGSFNVSVGHISMHLAAGNNNVGIGYQSLDNSSGSNNTGVGYNSLVTSTGTGNIGVGYSGGAYVGARHNRLFLNSIDRSNIGNDTTLSIIYGYQASTVANQRLYVNSNLFVNGKVSQYQDGYSTIFGFNAGAVEVVSSGSNTIFGNQASPTNSTGLVNTMIGANAGLGCAGCNSNVFVGYNTGKLTTTGGNHVCIGESAGRDNITGTGNVWVGKAAGLSSTGGGNIGIGFDAGRYFTTLGNNRLFINGIDRVNIAGDSTKSIIYGYQNNTVASQSLTVNGNLLVNGGNILTAGTGSFGTTFTVTGNAVFNGTTTTIKHLIGNTSAPTIASGSGLGTGAGTVVGVTASSTDLGMLIGVVTGTASLGTSAALATITYNIPYTTNAPIISLQPANQAAADLIIGTNIWASTTTSVLTLNTNTVALTAGTTYSWFAITVGPK